MNASIEIRTGNTTLENILKLKSFESTINIENSCAIMIAIQYSDTNTVKLLIDNGADVVTEDGDTPLHYAAMYGRLEIVQMLIAKGVDVNANFFDSGTPLDAVELFYHNQKAIVGLPVQIQRPFKEIIDLLHKHGAKTDEELKAKSK